MPVCSFPGGCTDYAVKGNVRCAAHQIRNGSDKKVESLELKKKQLADARAQAQAEEQAARNKVAQEKSDADIKRKALQQEVIRAHKQIWNAQVDNVVNQVLVLRLTDPNANAGNNAVVGNTLGGNGNPVSLVMTGATHGVSKGEITNAMAGFDSSDSGLFKFRRQGVLVHCA